VCARSKPSSPEKGYIDPAALDAIVEAYETKIGPRNGAVVVAKAWTDPAFKQALLSDATKAVASLGHMSRVGDHLVAVENTPARHNMIVCTLCSCYPWEVLDCRQSGTNQRRTARARSKTRAACSLTSASRCRKKLKFASGIRLRKHVFLVLPMRPSGTEGWNAEKLADLVTRDCMIGTGLPRNPARPPDGWRSRHGRHGRFRQGRSRTERPPFHATWEGRVLAMQRAMGYAGAWHIDHSRFAQEKLPPTTYLSASYYQRWALAMESMSRNAALHHLKN